MIRRPPRSTRTDPLFPDTTLFRSVANIAKHALTSLPTVLAQTRTKEYTPSSAHCRLFPPGYEDTLRSEEHTSELQSLMRRSYAVFCLQKKTSTAASNTAALQCRKIDSTL